MSEGKHDGIYGFKQINEIKKWGLNLGGFYLVFFTILDGIRYSGVALENALFARIFYMLIPFSILIVLFYKQEKFNLSIQQLDILSFVVILLVGMGHTEIIEIAASQSMYFPRIGLTIILIYAGILLVLPVKLSLLSSLLIILIAANTYVLSGMGWTEVMSLTSFYLAFSSCCVFMNYVCSRMLITNNKLVKAIEKQANTDELTGLFNRRYFFNQSEHVFKQAQRSGKSAAILVIDLDDFKVINDQLGHQYGDRVLTQFSAVLKKHCRRPLDMACRLGGDEFAVMLYDSDLPYINQVCHSIIKDTKVLAAQIKGNNQAAQLSVSIGVAFNQCDEAFPVKTLVEMADAAMYQVKHSGKNNFNISDKKDFMDEQSTSNFLSPV